MLMPVLGPKKTVPENQAGAGTPGPVPLAPEEDMVFPGFHHADPV